MEPVDWQVSRETLKDRGLYLLETGKWSDCNFLLGNDNQLISGHKLILASASPVFEAMFYGGLKEKSDPIPILDVQPEAFRALLEYIYTDQINIRSTHNACELCYVAKKYMLPNVVLECTKFLWKDLRPKNACRAYEFAKLFEEPQLMKKCLEIICNKTAEVIEDPGFEDAELETVMTILDQNELNVDSEMVLFYGLKRYAEKQSTNRSNASRSRSCSVQENGNSNESSEGDQQHQQYNEQEDEEPGPSREVDESREQNQRTFIRDALKKIRFLTLTPQAFAEGPGRSTLLTQAEAFAILMNISSPIAVYPMPEGFTINRSPRLISNLQLPATTPLLDHLDPFNLNEGLQPTPHMQHHQPLGLQNPLHSPEDRSNFEARRFYCVRSIRQQTDCLNTSVLDASLTFTVDTNICITGVQVPTQVLGESNMRRCDTDGNFPERYSELLYAHLLDAMGARLTYTHCSSRVRFDSMLEIFFDRPVYIQRNKMYKIGVVYNKVGWYPMCNCLPTMTTHNVCFTFGGLVGPPNESVRDGLIRAIVFTLPVSQRDHSLPSPHLINS